MTVVPKKINQDRIDDFGFFEVGDVSAAINGMKDGALYGISYHVTAAKITEMAPPIDKPTISNGESRQQWSRYLTVL